MSEFQFDEVTPELQALLEHSRGYDALRESTYPAYSAANAAWEAAGKPDGELKAERDRLYAVHYNGLEAHRVEGKRLQSLVASELMARYHLAHLRWHCRDETRVGEPKEHTSSSGKYRLVVSVHATGKGTWNYTKGVVLAGDRAIETVCRNYSSFPFLFVEEHPSGHDYLVCGYDYQGQTIVELDTGRRVDYPPGPFGGFCWSSYTASPSKRTLAVSGCYWGGPYEIFMHDFTDPMNGLPELHRCDDELSFIRWSGDAPDTCVLGHCYEVYVPTGTREGNMSDAECEDFDRRVAAGENECDLVREVRTEVTTWTRSESVTIPCDEEASK